MTFSKIIKAVTGGERAEVIGQGADDDRGVKKESKMLDLAHEALVRRAATDSNHLNGLIKMGWPLVQKDKFKNKVRKKVWDIVSEEAGLADSEMVDEITDRIVEVSEADEYYKKAFDKDES